MFIQWSSVSDRMKYFYFAFDTNLYFANFLNKYSFMNQEKYFQYF